MQDCKALQAGTSHYLGQNFAKAFDIRFQNAQEQEAFVHTTSWAVSTRLLGGLLMTHGDDDGAILPPRVASSHVVLMPIVRKAAEQATVMDYVNALAAELRAKSYHGRPLRVEVDTRDIGGARNWEWIKKGIPLRVEIGPRDIAADSVFVARRDRGHKERAPMPRDHFVSGIEYLLDDIQNELFARALRFRQEQTRHLDDRDAFYAYFTAQNAEKPEIHGGFALARWCGAAACEERIKEDLAVTIRCIPFDRETFPSDPGPCICCGGPDAPRVVFAKAY